MTSGAPRRRVGAAADSSGDAAGESAGLRALAQEPWPRGVSTKPTMNIGAVLTVLKREFPAVSHSKLRFLEEQGLVHPHRTPAGYRVFSDADVERLRYALAAQRDSFLPLRVIRDKLAALDAGLDEDALAEPRIPSGGGARLSAEELVRLADLTREELDDLDAAGLIVADAAGRYQATCLPVVQAASDLRRRGLDLRHLRLMRSAADRQVDVIAQLTAPLRGRPNAPQDSRAREKAIQEANDLSGLLSRLHGALVAAGVDRIV
ncbi:MerR family transcriptional regulator [Serinibacter salmoneus]|uniref:DNA-binding transcriptional MerR regulator n=1 Tax=Serinibacter salmoneus TaxID=556530 RepID=A0A2A9CZX1_9MICO|nr:MerR family transcriptional regulator [Serinibacter salmoneus]PFG19681.1 DNA-binding transcriptional MerR regulator [Serinibacter salmoneus]